MGIEKREVEYAKELNDVFVLLKDVAVCMKKKEDYTKLLPELAAAVENIGQIPEERKLNRAAFDKTALCGGYDIADALLV